MKQISYKLGVHIVGHRLEWKDGGGIESNMWKDVCPCIRMNDYKCPMNCLIEYEEDSATDKPR